MTDDGYRDEAARLEYLPTPAEIAAACERIRAGWSAQERRRRSAWSVEQARVRVQEVEAWAGIASAEW